MAGEMMNAQQGTIAPSVARMPTGGGRLSVFSNAENFNLAQRMANALAQSTIVPKAYQGNLGNCMIAIEMASRINTSPMMVMQNLYIVNGNPAWSSQWIIAMINSSRRYKTEIQFEFGHDEEDGGLSCLAWAEDCSGHRVEGPKITMKMAIAEGWVGKSGSKWKTMPEVMIRYRAASFFGRMNCPDMIMGIYSKEEVIEMGDNYTGPGMENLIVDADTGEVVEDPLLTQDERQALIKAAQTSLGKEDGNAVLKEVYKALGYETVFEIRKSAYDKILKALFDEALRRKDSANEKDENGGENDVPDEGVQQTIGDAEPDYPGRK